MVSWNDGETSGDSAQNVCSSCDSIVKKCINFGVVKWTDFEWPHSVEKALAKLWDMYEESKAARTTDNLESSFLIHNLTKEKKKLEENYEKLYGDVNALLDQQHRAVDSVEENNLKDNTNLQQKYDILKNLTAAQDKVIRNLKNTHLKEKERLTEERHKLQHHISELQKSQEKRKLKIHRVKAILDESSCSSPGNAADVLLTLLAGALELRVAAFEALLAGGVVLLSLLAGAIEVPAAIVEALLAGAIGGPAGGAPTDEAATVALLIGAPTNEVAAIAPLVGATTYEAAAVALVVGATPDEYARTDVAWLEGLFARCISVTNKITSVACS
ncbi:hypothetical protein D1007_22487 [Hordeum vulgare]|nr:hypothetical protein D1007_22487 [Hordeum vulgare]